MSSLQSQPPPPNAFHPNYPGQLGVPPPHPGYAPAPNGVYIDPRYGNNPPGQYPPNYYRDPYYPYPDPYFLNQPYRSPDGSTIYIPGN